MFTVIVGGLAGGLGGGLVNMWMNYDLNKPKVEVRGIRPVVVYHKRGWPKGIDLPPTYGVSFKAIIKIHNKSNFDEYFSHIELDGFVPVKPMYASSFDSTIKTLQGVHIDSLYEEYKNSIQRIRIMGLADYPGFRNGIVLPARKTTYVKVSFFEKKYPATWSRGGRPSRESLKLNSISKDGNKLEITGFNPDPKPEHIFYYKRIAGISTQIPYRLRKEFSEGDLMISAITGTKVLRIAPENILSLLQYSPKEWEGKSEFGIYNEEQIDESQRRN